MEGLGSSAKGQDDIHTIQVNKYTEVTPVEGLGSSAKGQDDIHPIQVNK